LDKLVLYIESLIFVADPSISFDGIKNALEESFNTEFSDDTISDALQSLMNKYENEEFSIEIAEIAGGFRFMTKAGYHHVVATYLKQNINKKLSKAALETLAVVSYKQPVSKTEIESIRGVNSDYSVQKLLEKDLIEITGRSEGPGRPLLYGTTPKFMDYFGLKSLEDLPKIKEITLPEHQIGEAAPIEEEQIIQKINAPKEEDQ